MTPTLPAEPALSLQDQLRALFLVDQQIRGLRSRVDASSRRLGVQRTRLEQHERQAEEIGQQLKHSKTKVDALENDAAAIEERVTKIRSTMTTVRNNKEYSALLVEVNTQKLEKSKIEDTAIEHIERVDEFTEKAAGINAKVDEQRKVVALAEKEVGEAKSEISDQLEALQKERDAAAEPVADDSLSLYQKLYDDFDGEALAEVEEQDRRRMEYTCGACFMSLPIQVVNATLTTKDRPVVCPTCDRILFVPDQLKEALVPK